MKSDDNHISISDSVNTLTDQLSKDTRGLLQAMQPMIDDQLNNGRLLARMLKTYVLSFDELIGVTTDGEIVSGTKIIPNSIQKNEDAITIEAHVQHVHSHDNLIWIQDELKEIHFKLDELSQSQSDTIQLIRPGSTFIKTKNLVEQANLNLSKMIEDTPTLTRDLLVINGVEIVFTPGTKQVLLLACFFSKNSKPKTRGVYFEDLYDLFEPNWVSLSGNSKRKLKKSVFDTRRNINNRIKQEALTSLDFLVLESEHISINPKVIK